MYISQTAAQNIVDEIGREIKEHVNLMNEEGYIVASTDPLRIGMLHDGARKIIKESLSELYITSEMETRTTRKGINLPITIDGEIVGVIGITGERERVAGYGNIVRRMTEIMVRDTLRKDSHRYDRRVRYRFMEEWIAKSGTSYDRELIERGKRLGIDIEKPRRAIVFGFENYQLLSGTLDGQRRLEEMEAAIRHFIAKEKDILYLREPPRQICLVRGCADERLRVVAEGVIRLVSERFGEIVFAGMDSENGGSVHIGHICEEAEKAAENCTASGRQLVFYKELSVELFLDEVSEDSMKRYLDKLFPDMELKELDAFMKLIDAYFRENGSIGSMAELLFMHKNTIQYKLKKLAELSGRDIRTPVGAAIHYMALTFYKKLYPGQDLMRSF